jgi:hypothetical protein
MLLESSSTRDPNDPNTWSEEEQIKYVQEKYDNIKNIKNPSEKVQLAAVRENGYAIEHIENPSEKVQLAAIHQDGYAIEYIKDPTEKVQDAAIEATKGFAVVHIKNASERSQLKALEYEPYVIEYIRNPTERTQLFAIQKAFENEKDLSILDGIVNPTPFVETIQRVLSGDHISAHQKIKFVEEALEKSKQYPFLLHVLEKIGWTKNV